MNKVELIELLEHKLNGGNTVADQRGKYDPRIISYHIGLVFNQIFYDTFDRNPADLDLYAQEYRGVEIKQDSSSNEYYSDLPSKLVQMRRGAGIRQIRAMGLLEETETFKPTTVNAASMLSRGDLGTTNTDTWYYPRGTKVFYVWMDTNVTEVAILMLVPFQNLADDAEIYIPSGKEKSLFDAVEASLKNLPPEDKRNDNVSKVI